MSARNGGAKQHRQKRMCWDELPDLENSYIFKDLVVVQVRSRGVFEELSDRHCFSIGNDCETDGKPCGDPWHS
jgi:hypothetical protein